MTTINLIYFGEKYITKSGVTLSSLYTENGECYDWDSVCNALSKEKTVNIRPATIDELEDLRRGK